MLRPWPRLLCRGVGRYAVGLGNVWRFPYLCYQNGGGAFLIPYALMLLLIGLPLFFLELSLGQFFRRGAWGCMAKIHPALAGLGAASLVVSFNVGLYYNTIIGYCLIYLFSSFTSELPWDGYECHERPGFYKCSELGNVTETELYWYSGVLQSSKSIEDGGSIDGKILGALLGAWLIVGLCEIKGIQSAGYVVYFTATFPYVVLVILFFRGVTLPGAADGIKYYLTPDFAR